MAPNQILRPTLSMIGPAIIDIAVGSGQGYPRGVLTHPSRVTGWVYPPLTHPKTLQGWYRVSIILLLFFRLKSTCSLRLWCFTHHATSSFGTSIMVGFVYLLLT